MRMVVRLAAVLTGVAIGTAAAVQPPGESPRRAAAAPARPTPPPTAIWVEVDGQARPLPNGGRVAVGDINVEVFVAPYPPPREGTIDLYFTDRATARPLQEHTLRVIFDMDMPHGSIRAEALPAGGGHYLVPYKLVMPGQWRVDITVARGSSVVAFALIFKVD